MKFSVATFLTISAILLSSVLASSSIQGVTAQPYYEYYGYNYYTPYYYPYSSYGYGAYKVTISSSGLPSEFSTTVRINGNQAGTVPGGTSKQFEVRSVDTNVFQVESYVSGPAGVRYGCREATWTLEKTTSTGYNYPYYSPYYYRHYYYPSFFYYRINYSAPYTAYYYYPSVYYYPYYYPDPSSKPQTDAAHTFTYAPEYMLTVENPYAQSVEKTGWKQKDTIVTISTAEKVDSSNVERSIFKAWNVDGSEIRSSTITLTMSMPHRAVATYDTQYYLDVKSELDHPQGSGWYNKDSEATISVLPEVPMGGFWGYLGAKNVFDSWIGPAGISAAGSTMKVTVTRPMILTAVWEQDYSIAYALMATVIAAILLIAFLAIIASRRYLALHRREREPAALETLNLRYSTGEITRENYLKMKEDLEKSSGASAS